MLKRTIDEATRRKLAVEASCDPRTIDKALRGEPIRGLAGHRARAALAAAGVKVVAGEGERHRQARVHASRDEAKP